jgi:hypothetical protein
MATAEWLISTHLVPFYNRAFSGTSKSAPPATFSIKPGAYFRWGLPPLFQMTGWKKISRFDPAGFP